MKVEKFDFESYFKKYQITRTSGIYNKKIEQLNFKKIDLLELADAAHEFYSEQIKSCLPKKEESDNQDILTIKSENQKIKSLLQEVVDALDQEMSDLLCFGDCDTEQCSSKCLPYRVIEKAKGVMK